ncbi:penicillin-binding protein 1A [Megalodesulfovibrio gigas]|uniref:Penicillin-binding protein 1A n=1 Tax=Megalodesulfovibrio gigas (strain ATCC 19364 / DSM 1382 / NCIMB 9332 / VKM B-1759) TaxID=1121448 RepID=T2G9D6_MEGG1|nr:PBP1A family penicillin-binding protein [Megalodesulfovibrio gigas]AGW12789.1 putative penicillin-binding, 1A family protein [Megalodesulfovibrio gigas DSM 1382 = ATCC 19364]
MNRVVSFLLTMTVLAVLFAFTGIVGVYLWASHDLPSFTRLTDYNPPLTTTVYTRQGDVMGYFYREKRFLVQLTDCPVHLPRAFLAAEDQSFYQHPGVDLSAILRAMVRNLMAGEIRQGGSTITQQVIKQLVLSPEKSFERKIKEAIIAYRMEKYLSKDDLLTIYMNHIYLGAGAYGVEAAARAYFGKHVGELTLAESAVIAGLPKAPSEYDPHRNPEKTRVRQEYVLGRLLELGWVTQAEYDEAMAQPLNYRRMEDPSWKVGPYYLEEVRRWLVESLSQKNLATQGVALPKYGEDAVYELGLQVVVGMDMTHQRAAEAALTRGLEAASRRQGWQGPIKQIPPAEFEAFLAGQRIKPESLTDGAWVQALVTKVNAEGATVRVGPYQGRIALKTMSWCRKPNPAVNFEAVAPPKDAARILAVGDVVWASVIDPRLPARPVEMHLDGPALSRPGSAGTAPAATPVDPSQGLTLALEQKPNVQGALVSLEPGNGEVRALAGGYSFEDSQFNRATQAQRQPGSSFKPVVYSAALDNGFTPASIIMDSPAEYRFGNQVWRPGNFEGKFFGPTLLRTALVKSRNLVTIRVAERIGIDTVIKRAKALGLEADFPKNLAVSLGAVAVRPINLCQAYTAFARPDGATIAPRLVLVVRDAWGQNILLPQPVVTPAISPENAYLMASMLKDVVQYGTGRKATTLGRPIAGKTGTANDEQDAWFVGFSPSLLTGVWVGMDQVTPMGKLETGGRAALPIFVSYRQVVEKQYPVTDFPMPQGVLLASVSETTGLPVPNTAPDSLILPFMAGTEPQATDMLTEEAYFSPDQENASAPGTPGTPGETGRPKSTGEELFKQLF